MVVNESLIASLVDVPGEPGTDDEPDGIQTDTHPMRPAPPTAVRHLRPHLRQPNTAAHQHSRVHRRAALAQPVPVQRLRRHEATRHKHRPHRTPEELMGADHGYYRLSTE